MSSDRTRDERWNHALNGLPVIVFTAGVAATNAFGEPTRKNMILRGEITGCQQDHFFVVIDGEDEPRRVYWTEVRPA